MAAKNRTRRKRPCSICKRWFLPDPRVGARQKCCSNPSCQKKRRTRNQASWRQRNPDYMCAWRLETKAKDEMKSREPPSTLPPLSQLPWDIAKDEFGTKGAEFIGSLGRVLLQTAKDQNKAYSAEYMKKFGQYLEGTANA